VGIAQRFPSAVENLPLVFQAFHGPTFPQSTFFGSFLVLLGRATEAVRFSSGLQDVRSIRDAIKQRFA
jgi:hypothetical protein